MQFLNLRKLLTSLIVIFFAVTVMAQDVPADATLTETPTLIPTDIPTETPTETALPPTETLLPTETPLPTTTLEPTVDTPVTSTPTPTSTISIEPTTTLLPTQPQVSGLGGGGTCLFSISAGDVNGLIDAINGANTTPGADTICLADNATYTLTVLNNTSSTGKNALPVITSDITLQANHATLTRSGGVDFRYIEVDTNGILTIQDLTLANAVFVPGISRDGAIYTRGQLTVQNSTFTSNNFTGISVIAGTTTVTQTAFSNSSDLAISNPFGTVLVSNATFTNNTYTPVYNNGTMTIDSSTFLNNHVTTMGGSGAVKNDGNLIITGSRFEGNSASAGYTSGAVTHSGTDNTSLTTITNSVFLNNLATNTTYSQGAALWVQDAGEMHVSNTCFYGNHAILGGAVSRLGNTAMNFLNNWWGRYDGPIQPGTNEIGEVVEMIITPNAWLTSPPTGCLVHPPTKLDQNLTTLYRTPKNITLAAAGGLPPYTFAVATNPAFGILTGTVPNLTYSPNPGFVGTDSFTFTATNASGESATGTISVKITSDIAAVNQTFSAAYNPAGIPVTLSGTGGWSPYTFTVLTNPQHGTVTGTPPNVVYTPNTLFVGSDSFTFKVSDESAFSSTGTINLTVTWDLNGQDQTLFTPFNTPHNVTLTANGGVSPYTFDIISGPASGTLTGTAPTFIYTPNAGFVGLDTLTFKTTDSLGFTDTGTVNINVASAPQAINQYLYTQGVTPKAIALQTTGGRPPFTYSITTQPINGTLSGTPPSLSYTFNSGFTGIDSFTFTTTDANGSVSTGTVKVSNSAVLKATVTSIFTPYQTNTVLPLGATGGVPPYTITVLPPMNYGSVAGGTPDWIYTPNAGYSGTHTLSYRVIDSAGYQDTGAITITVGTPLALPDQILTTQYETPLVISATATGGLSPYSYTHTAPLHGTLSGTEPNLVYTPQNAYSGSDSFTVTVVDALSNSVTSTITIDVHAPLQIASGDVAGLIAAIVAANASPGADTIILAPGTYTLSTVYSGISDNANGLPALGDTLTIRSSGSVITRAANAPWFRIFKIIPQSFVTLDGLTISNGDLGITGLGAGIYNEGNLTLLNSKVFNNRAFSGAAIYSLKPGTLLVIGSSINQNQAQNGNGAINSTGAITVTSSIIARNSTAFAIGELTSLGMGGTSGNVTNSCIAGNGHTSVSNRNSNAIWLNFQNNWWGAASGPSSESALPYVGDSVSRWIETNNFVTTPILGCPAASEQAIFTPLNHAVALILQASSGLAPYTFSILTNPTNGTLTGTAPNLTYTPNLDFSGTDKVVYGVLDSNGLPATGVLTITVAPTLVATNGVFGTPLNTPANLTLGAIGGQPTYTYSNISTPSHGILTGTAPNLTYTPAAGYEGSDTFTFTVTDANGSTADGTITVVIGPLVAQDQSFTTASATNKDFVLSALGGAMPYTFNIATAPQHGYIIGTAPNLIYSPVATFSGTDTFDFVVQDQLGNTDTGTITITVGSLPSATIVVDTTTVESPSVNNGNCSLREAITAANNDTAVDACPAGGNVDIIELPAGTLTLNAPLPVIGANITIRGAGMDVTYIKRSPTGSALSIFSNSGTLRLQSMTLSKGYGNSRGGGVYNTGSLTVESVKFDHNYAVNEGGAIYGIGDTNQITVSNSAFVGNTSTFRGSAIFMNLGTLNVYNSVFVGNTGDSGSGVEGESIWAIGNVQASYSCFVDVPATNYPSVYYAKVGSYPATMNAKNNWWGNGPRTSNVDLEPRLTTHPASCDIAAPQNVYVADGDVAGLIAAVQYGVSAYQPITVHLAANGTYELTQLFATKLGLPLINGSLTLDGHGATIHRSSLPGTPTFRFFSVVNGTLSLSNLVLSNGYANQGGAIEMQNSANLSLNNVTLIDNQTPADSFSNGGAIYTWGSGNTITIQNSRFEHNIAGYGGAIELYMDTNLNITSTVFTRNQATYLGSSLNITRSKNISLTNNCFVSNQGASFNNDTTNNGSNTVINAVNNWWGAINGPSGAAQGSGDAISNNVTYAPFITTKPANCPIGPLVTINQNLSMPYYQVSLPITLSATGGVPNYTFAVMTPPNHGSLTGTPPNMSYSPNEGYIGQDTFSYSVTDSDTQTKNGSVSITVDASSILVNSLNQEVPFVDNGNCTLGEAIQAANTDTAVDACPAGSGDDIIQLTAGTYTLTVPQNTLTGANGLPVINSIIRIDGSGSIIERSSLNGTPDFRLFYVDTGATLELHNLTVRNGRLVGQNFNTDHGGAIYSAGSLLLDTSTISDNQASYYGGGLYFSGISVQLQITNSTIKDNQAAVGGGLWSCGPATISNSLIQHNFASYAGGGIYNVCNTVTITGSHFINNISSQGGALANKGNGEHLVINQSIFDQNDASVGSSIANNQLFSSSTVSIANSCLLDHKSSTVYDAIWFGGVTAVNNWWGSVSGPGGVASGYGSGISGQNVKFTPFLTNPILGCARFGPTAVDQKVTTSYQTSKPITLSGIDGKAPYTFTVLTQPASGTLTGNLPNLTFTPDNGFALLTMFTFKVTDANGDTDTGEVLIQVKPQLVAANPNLTTNYQTSLAVNFGASGGQSPYSYSVTSQPQHGTLTGSGLSYNYLPDTGYSGVDSFTYQVTDALGATASGAVNITVGTPISATNQDLTTFQNTSITFSLAATGGSSPYTFAIVTQPNNGVLRQIGSLYTYIPRIGYSGFDSLIFSVTDSKAASATGVINLAVNSTSANLPSNLSIVNTLRPTFMWTAFGGAAQYHLQADTDGTFISPLVDVTVASTNYSILGAQPELDQGQYHWRVAAVKGTQEIWSNTPQFIVFLGKSPMDNSFSTVKTPTFTWASVPSATGYRLQISDNASFSTFVVDKILGLVTTYTLPSALPYGTYYWRILQQGETPVNGVYRTITITPTALPAPVLTAGSVVTLTNNPLVSLSWNAVNGAASYQVQVDNSTSFNTVLEFEWQGNGTQVTTTTLPDGVYAFRVRALNTYGAPGTWSVVRSFTVDTASPLPPVLSTPVAGAVVVTGRPLLTWAAAVGATKYQVVIDTDAQCDATPSGLLTTLSYTAPVMAQGSYYWCMRSIDAAGNVGTWSVARRININLLSLPVNGAVIISPTIKTQPILTWNAMAGATGYTVQIDDEISFTNPTVVTLGKVTSYKVTPGLNYGTYYWQVIPDNVPQTAPVYWRFSITPTTLPAPVLTAGSVVTLTNNPLVSLSWNAVNGAASYQVQVDNSTSFNTVLEFEWQGSGTQVTTTTLPDGVYAFRVRALNTYGAPGTWSVVRSFTVDTTPPPSPVLSTPVAGAVVVTGRPLLTWAAAVGASKYQVVIDTDSQCDATPSGLLTTLSYTAPVTAQGSYYWCVRSIDAAGNVGTWSVARRININLLSLPVNGAVIISPTIKTQPILTWNAMAGATGYTVQIDDEISFTNPTVVTLGKVTSYKVTPGLNYGTYYWQVIPDNVPQTALVYWRFSITPSSLPAPVLTAGSVVTLTNNPLVSLSWNVVNGAVSYQVQVDNSTSFNTVLEFEWQGSGTQVTTTTLPDGVYAFRVRALNTYGAPGTWSVVRSFTVDTTPPLPPLLKIPINTLVITNTRTPIFTWIPSLGAVNYVIEIATDLGFSHVVARYNVAGGASSIAFTWPAAVALPNGNYYWHVRARDNAGNVGVYSGGLHFVIAVP